jgi:hypothetical protein
VGLLSGPVDVPCPSLVISETLETETTGKFVNIGTSVPRLESELIEFSGSIPTVLVEWESVRVISEGEPIDRTLYWLCEMEEVLKPRNVCNRLLLVEGDDREKFELIPMIVLLEKEKTDNIEDIVTEST